MATRYVHTNIIADDWRRLARFYQDVFGCEQAGPERDLSGDWLEAATQVPGARLKGVHLRLPGHGDAGPSLEIFSYDHNQGTPSPPANRKGLGHIAFSVDNVEAMLSAVIRHGGTSVGALVRTEVPHAGSLTFVYARDPEGNIIELQKWG